MPQAKFRCMSVNRDACGHPFSPEHWRVEARLLPIKAFPNYDKNGDPAVDPDHAKENADFWKYTPSGEACWFHDADLGAAYYIDLIPDEAGEWKCSEYTLSEGYLNVRLSHEIEYEVHTKDGLQIKKRLNGEFFEMGVNREEASPGAWQPFVDGGPGSRWRVVFRRAEG